MIATQSTPEQKEEMLSLIGVYMEAGYYAINYDNVQHYRIFLLPIRMPKIIWIGKGWLPSIKTVDLLCRYLTRR